MTETATATEPGTTRLTAVVRGGRLELPRPLDLPDGTEVTVHLPAAGAPEWEQTGDPAEVEAWCARVAALPTLVESVFRQPDEFDEAFRRFNVDAVRKQMGLEPGP